MIVIIMTVLISVQTIIRIMIPVSDGDKFTTLISNESKLAQKKLTPEYNLSPNHWYSIHKR